MKFNRKIISYLFIAFGLVGVLIFYQINTPKDKIIYHIVDLKKQELKFYWKNDNKENFKNFKNLKYWLNSKSENLVFAMNAGIFDENLSPLGLYIEDGIIKSKTNTIQNGYGNFYLQPNGIFYITKNDKGIVCKTDNFKNENVKYATQSGPLLLFNGKINSKFNMESQNLNIRNGVGILPDGKLLFAMSRKKINFYKFAYYFKSFGCKNALYLDGYVSKTYLPEKGFNAKRGNFGVIIGETKRSE